MQTDGRAGYRRAKDVVAGPGAGTGTLTEHQVSKTTPRTTIWGRKRREKRRRSRKRRGRRVDSYNHLCTKDLGQYNAPQLGTSTPTQTDQHYVTAFTTEEV